MLSISTSSFILAEMDGFMFPVLLVGVGATWLITIYRAGRD